MGHITCCGRVQDVYHVSIQLVTMTPIIVEKAKCQPLVRTCGDNGLNDDDDLSQEGVDASTILHDQYEI